MRRMLAGAALAILLAACGSSHPVAARPPALQRFDELRTVLARVDAASAKVAADVQTTNRQMQRDDVSGARSAAVTLKRDAHLLQRRAGQAAARVRPLATAEANGTVRRYFSLVDDMLAQQWAEGQDLTPLADLVWADPLMMSPRDVQKLQSVQGKARAAAEAAVAGAAKAAAWRRAHNRSFRYVPVRQAV